MDTDHRCRVCLAFSNCCTSLFSKQNGASVAQMIRFCAGVLITEEDDLPPNACPKCCEEATFAYMFVNKCRKSDAELRTLQILGQQSNKNVSRESAECCEKSPHLMVHTNNKNEPDHIKLEVGVVEALEEPVDDISVHSWQDHTEGNGTKHLDDDTDDCENEEEEYLYESDAAHSVVEPDEGVTGEHDLTIKLDVIDHRNAYFCCHTDCTLTFSTKPMLQEHIHSLHQRNEAECENSTKRSNHQCSNCSKFFSSESDLRKHESCLVLKQSSLRRRRFGRPKLYPSVFDAPVKICCGCFERFSTTEALLAHSEAVHAIRKTATDPTRPVQCQICYKLFRSEAHVRTHRIAVYKPRNHCCTICNASYSTASKLTNHLAVHQPERKYVCAECGACLKTKQNLKMHSLLHREKREVCKTCGLRFHRKSNLKMHQRIHENTFYHVCPHCSKKLKTLAQLKEHLKVHTKEKPHECRYCDKRFGYYSDRSRHEMVHTGNYPFDCNRCLKKFSRSLSYYRHLSKCSHDDTGPLSDNDA